MKKITKMKKKTMSRCSAILLAFFLIISPVVSAGWSLPKWDTCHTFNKTEAECDAFWCGIVDCNATTSAPAGTYYNKTEIDAMFKNSTLSGGYYNKTEIDGLLLIDRTNKTYTDEQVRALRDSQLGRIDNLTTLVAERTSGLGSNNYVAPESTPAYVWIIGLLGVCGLIGFLAWTGIKKKEYQPAKPSIKEAYKKTKKAEKVVPITEAKEEPEEEVEEEKEEINPNEYVGDDE